MTVDPAFYTPYPTSPTRASHVITEVDTQYLFGLNKSIISTSDLPVIVPDDFEMSKLGPFRVEGRLVTYGQVRVWSGASPVGNYKVNIQYTNIPLGMTWEVTSGEQLEMFDDLNIEGELLLSGGDFLTKRF